jgi:hypothetical protein
MHIKTRSLVDRVVAVLERQPLCVDCLARKLSARRDDVARALNDLRRAFRLSSQAARCGPCGSVTMTYRVADAPFALGGSSPPRQEP